MLDTNTCLVFNRLINRQQGANMATICDLTLHELMAEEFDVFVKRNKKFGFDLDIEGWEEESPRVHDKGIHPCAIESLAAFCRRFLMSYDAQTIQ